MKRVISLCVLLLALSTTTATAARLFGGSLALELTSALVASTPFSVSLWMYPTAANLSAGIFSIEVDGSNDNRWAISTSSASQVLANTRTTTAANATTTATWSQNVWTHVGAVWPADTSRTIYLAGGNAVTNSGSALTPTGMNRTRIARFLGAAPVHFTGRLADVCVWNVAISAKDMEAHGQGVSCRCIQPTALVAHVPIWGIDSPEPDWARPRSWTLQGSPTAAPGPPVALKCPGMSP